MVKMKERRKTESVIGTRLMTESISSMFWFDFDLILSKWIKLFVLLLFLEGDAGGPQESKPPRSSKHLWRSQRVRPAATRQPKEDSKDSRHPFALYGSGEKDADIASRKTHNVGPAASTKEVITLSFAPDLYDYDWVSTGTDSCV